MKIPLKYSLRNFTARKLTTGITVTGIALVVFVFAAVLMMAYGIQKTLTITGSEENVLVARKSANGEISSIIPGDIQSIVSSLPNIAKTSDGKQIISYEPVVIINLEKQSGGLSNISVRGVSEQVQQLRPNIKIIEGRNFVQGRRELIVGESLANKFLGCQIGGKIKFAGDYWTVVGKFTTDGSGFDSEIWGDALQLLDAFSRGNAVSTMTLKLANPSEYASFKLAFDTDKRLQQYEPEIETKFFAKQSELMAGFIRILGIFVTVIFSLGATIGAMITMYASVANRTVEIGTLRALGFRRRSILAAFLAESFLIALVGGIIGLALASLLQFVSISTLNFGSFTELAFNFALSPDIIISSLLFAVAMGFLGGFLPSVRAARMNILQALRAE